MRIERELPTDTLYRLVAATPLDEVGADRPSVGALVTRVTSRCLGILRAVSRATANPCAGCSHSTASTASSASDRDVPSVMNPSVVASPP